MRFVTFQHESKTSAGVLRSDSVLDLSRAFTSSLKRSCEFRDLEAFLKADGPGNLSKIDLNDNQYTYPLQSVQLMSPIFRPPKINCVGLNYRDHAEEQGHPIPSTPIIFPKAANAVIGNGDTIVLPPASKQVDYEVEFAVIISKEAYNVKAADASDYIFGYTIMNDVSARDLQFADKQWYRAKSYKTFAPLGPVVVTPDELDVKNLEISLKLNGQVMQKSNTKNLIFDVPFLIEFISSCFPLEPGEIISTGTPGGVGVFRDPPVFLKPGDKIEAEIQGIGTLVNTTK